MNALPVEDLLASLGDDAPCGTDLEYDPAFLAFDEAAQVKSEQQFGETVIPAKEPDWRVAHEQAFEVARRTRDIRVAVMLARAPPGVVPTARSTVDASLDAMRRCERDH
jgi:type VI secretion system protein ImpA